MRLSLVTAFIKLKYELAAVRKEILRASGVANLIDVSKRYLDNFDDTITELHLNGGNCAQSSTTGTTSEGTGTSSDSTDDTDETVTTKSYADIDVKLEQSSRVDSGDETYYSSTDCNTTSETPMRSVKREVCDQMLSISVEEYYRLKESDRKAVEYEQKVMDLEEELKKLYLQCIRLIDDKKLADEEVERLRTEVYFMENQLESRPIPARPRKVGTNYKQRLGAHSYFNSHKPSFSASVPHKSPPMKTMTTNAVPEALEANIRPIYHNKKYVPFVEY